MGAKLPWFWNGFYSFLDTCGVPHSLRARYPRESFNKYDLMRNILTDLESAGDLDTVQALVSGFYRLRGAVDRDKLDVGRAKTMLDEFRQLVGHDPIEAEVKRREQQAARETHKANVGDLVEAKWTKGPTKQEALSVFDGKIRGKAQSTRGFFISASRFDDNAISKFSGDAPRIILMTGEDLALVLSGMITFPDAMRAKVDAIVRHGRILLELRGVAR